MTGTTAGVWSGGSALNGSPNASDIAQWTNSSLGAGLTLATSSAWGGISVSNALSDIYIGGAGILTNGAGGIDMSASAVNFSITNPVILSASQTWNVNAGLGLTNYGTVGNMSSAALTKAGAGTLAFGGTVNFTNGTTVGAGLLQYLINFNTYRVRILTINSGAVAASSATLNLAVNQNGSTGSTNVQGAGILRLTSTTNSATAPDLYFGPDHSGTAYYGATLNTTQLDLGTLQRYIFAKTGHNSIGRYYPGREDVGVNSSIIGSGGITYIAQMGSYGSPPLEVQMALMGSNTFTGPLQIQRGSVYMMNAYALTQTNTLFLNSSGTNNARFFLYGKNIKVANLSSSVGGTNTIANGNVVNPSAVPAATLTVNETSSTTFSGSMVDSMAEYDAASGSASGALSLALTGTGTLTLSNANTYSGSTTVSSGTLVVNGSLGAGAVTVQGGTLAGNGTIGGAVTVNYGGTLMTAPSGISALTINNTLGLAGNISLRINSSTATSDLVQGLTGVTYGGTLTVTDLGSALANGQSYTLFSSSSYSGSFTNLVLPTLPFGLSWDISQLAVNGTIAVANTAAKPVFSPVPGGYVGIQPLTVTLSSLTPGAIIYYTLNGTTPTSGSPSGSSPVTITLSGTTNVTIQAYTHATGYSDSVIASGTYMIEPLAVWTNSAGGSWASGLNWTNNIVVNNSGATADFSQLTLTAPTFVTLDGSWTVGNMIFGDVGNANTWEVDAGSGGPLTLAATNIPTITVNNQTTTIGAILAGSQGLNYAGTGGLTLNGVNTYSGPTVINAGTLQLGNSGLLGGGTYAGAITNNGAFIDNSVTAQTLNGGISGTGGVTVSGGATLILSGTNSYAGGTTLNSGSVTIGNGNSLGNGIFNVNLPSGGTFLTVANTGPVTITNNIILSPSTAGQDTFVKNSAGAGSGTQVSFLGNISGGNSSTTLFLNSNTGSDNTTTYLFGSTNTFLVSEINLNRGAIVVANSMGLGDPSNLIYLDGNDNSTLGDLRFAISMTLTNPIELVESTTPISTSSNNVVLLGQISSAGSPTLNKLGTGTLTLLAANTYSGPTIVSGGILEVDNSSSSSAITVATNAELSGDGVISGPLTINGGGTLGAGTNAGVGMLTLNSTLTLNANSTNFMRITKTSGILGNDQIGGLTGILNFAGTLVVSNITSDSHVLAPGDSFTLFASSGTYSGNFSTLVLPPLSAGLSWDVSQLTVSGTIAVSSTAAKPVFNPLAGGYVGAQTITISSLTPGATIYYTTNGTTPTSSSPSGITPVTVSISGNTNVTIQAYAHEAGYTDSGIASATYFTEPRAVWTSLSGGSWATASNWTNNIIPNGGDITADFSQLTLVSPTYVTLDNHWTIGNLIFGDVGNANTWEVDTGTAGPLTLMASNSPTITVNNQMTTIAATLAGTNGLTMAGPGILALSATNTYTGPTIINTGTLQINDPGLLENGTDNDVLTNNGSLVYNSTSAQTFNGNISGTGSLTMSSSSTLVLNGSDTYTGGTVLNSGSISISTGNALGTGAYTVNLAASGTFLTVANTSALTVQNNIVLPAAGITCTLIKNSSAAGSGTPVTLAGNISGGSSSTELFLNSNTGGDNTTTYVLAGTNTFLASEINLNRGALVVASPYGLGDPSNLIYLDANNNTTLGDLRFAISMTVTNPIQVVWTGGNNINTDTNNVILAGQVSGSANLTKLGAGRLTFTTNNTYSGTTLVNGGNLEVDGALASSAVTVATNSTLSGTGNISSTVTVNAGGTLAAGTATGAGTLTLANTLSLGNNTTNLTYSNFKLAAGGNVAASAVNVNGTNFIKLLDSSLSVGTNTLFTYTGGSIGGTSGFAGFQLATLPMGVTAHLIDTGSAIQIGVTSVVTVNTNPPVLTNSISGNTLTFSWPTDHLGWRLQVQTNSLSVGLKTNWYTWPNSTNVTSVPVTINSTNGAVFFRLVYP